MLGVRNQRQKREQRERVRPPERRDRRSRPADEERGQVGDHQHEDEQRDQAGFPRKLAEPLGSDKESADEESENPDRAGRREDRGEVKVELAPRAQPDRESQRRTSSRSGSA